MCKVSIIMSAYNEAKTIRRSIDSIINQSYSDWKLLVCNDGSKDETLHILREYESTFPGKVIVFDNDQNKGLTYSLNRLISVVDTDYIARMDADDICDIDRIKKQVYFLESNVEYSFVGSAINKFDDKGVFATVIFPERPTREALLWNSPFVHPSILIKTSVLKELHGYRDIKKTVRCEDYDLWFRAYASGYKGYNLQEALLNYFEGRQSYSKRKFKYRLNEARVRLEGYKINGMLLKGMLFIPKPIIVGLIPQKIMIWYRSKLMTGKKDKYVNNNK